MKKFFYAVMLSMFFMFIGCTTVETPNISEAQYREYTTREINSDYKTVFKSTLSVLQDQRYIIQSSDFNGGLISAEKEMDKNATFGDFLAILFVDRNFKRRGNMKISVVLTEKTSTKTKVRVTLQEKYIEHDSLGDSVNNIVNIQNKEVYDAIFDKINMEIDRNR